jgi:hypothetical protein
MKEGIAGKVLEAEDRAAASVEVPNAGLRG